MEYITLLCHFRAYKNPKPLFLRTFMHLGVGWVEQVKPNNQKPQYCWVTKERQREGGRRQEVLENNSSLCQKGLKPRSFIYEKQKICILGRAAQKIRCPC